MIVTRVRCVRVLWLGAALAMSALFYGHYYNYTLLVGTERQTNQAQDLLVSQKSRLSQTTFQKSIQEHTSEFRRRSGISRTVKRLDGKVNSSNIQTKERKIDIKKGTTLPRLVTKRKAQQPVPACPISIRDHVQNDTFFKKLFNFDIPVLMWDRHLTKETEENLTKRMTPYGWKDIPMEDVTSTLKLLNDSANRRLFDQQKPKGCISCAVVGNGGILNGSRKGKEIDQHDYVFRVNGAVTKGFEEDVGVKTSFYGFTVNTMKNSLIGYNIYGYTETPKGEGLRYIFIPCNKRDYVMLRSSILGVTVPSGADEGDKPSDYYGPEATPKKFKFLHPDFLLYIRDIFLYSDILNTEFAYLYMPSTGGLMLMTALHTCDKVDVYGFITLNYNLYSNHYFEKEKIPLQFYVNHDMLLEMDLWKKLHDSGIMNLYQR